MYYYTSYCVLQLTDGVLEIHATIGVADFHCYAALSYRAPARLGPRASPRLGAQDSALGGDRPILVWYGFVTPFTRSCVMLMRHAPLIVGLASEDITRGFD